MIVCRISCNYLLRGSGAFFRIGILFTMFAIVPAYILIWILVGV